MFFSGGFAEIHMSDATQWFLVQAGNRKGPFTEFQIRDMAVKGSLRGEDLIWKCFASAESGKTLRSG